MTEKNPKVLLGFLQRASSKQFYRYVEPIGLMTLAAGLDSHGYCPRVYTGAVTDALPVFEQIQRTDGVLAIGLYCDYENRNVVESFSRTIKAKHAIPVLVGGPQGYFLGADFLRASRCDAVGRGEGEYLLPELLDCLLKGKGTLQDIPGITYLDSSGNLQQTPDRPPIENLDALPLPHAAYSLTGPKNNLAVLTGRGCPFRCAFCFEGGNTRRLRLRSVERVMAEIEQGFRDHPGLRYVWFADDTFTLHPQRVSAFCNALTALRRRHDFVWFCDAHPSLIVRWPHMVREMIQAGLVRMQIGIETGSPQVVKLYNKNTDLAQIEEVVDLCCREGLPQLCGNIILGGAAESGETLAETGEFVERLIRRAPGVLDITHTIYTPFPGTAISRCPEKFGMQTVDADSLSSTGDFPVATTDSLTLEQIASARKSFFTRIHKLMCRLAFQGSVPHEKIRRHYELFHRYGISSTWHHLVYSQNLNFDRRYRVLATGCARSFGEIPKEEISFWRPARIPFLGNNLDFRGESLTLYGSSITLMEYQVLLHCTGKLSIGELLQRREGAGKWKEHWPRSESELYHVLQDLDSKNFLTFTRY